MKNNADITAPKKELSAVCGLFCPSCPVYIGTHEDRERLEKLAVIFGTTVEEMECEGCRTDKRCTFCDTRCKMRSCAEQKGIDFCGECENYPCNELKDFQKAMPNRIEIWESQKRILEAGYEVWFWEMLDLYTCPDCKTINSAVDFKCRNCGRIPGNKYVEIHRDEIREIQQRLMKNGFKH